MRLDRCLGTVLIAAACAYTCAAPNTASPKPDAAAKAKAPAEAAPEAPEDNNGRVERGNLVIEGVPEVPVTLRDRLQQYQNTRSATLSGWLDQGILIRTRFGETYQFHRVEQPMGARQQLTFYNERVAGGAVRPSNGRTFVMSRDVGGNELYQLSLFDLDSGLATPITDPDTRNGSALWSDDGRWVAWNSTTAQDPNYSIVALDMNAPDEPAGQTLWKGEGYVYPGDWSADNSQLLLGRYISPERGEMYLLKPGEGAEPTQIRPDLEAFWAPVALMKDAVLAVTDYKSEFRRLVRVSLRGKGDPKVLTPDLKWNIERMEVAPDGRTGVYAVNVDGGSELYLIDLKTGASRRGPKLPPGVIDSLRFNDDGSKVAVALNAYNSPSDVWSFEVKGQKLTRWTASEIGGLNADNFAQPELIRYPSDDITVPAWVYRPKNRPVDGAKTPVVVSIHGGPASQHRPRFNPSVQAWVGELGVAVVAPNVRGSSGYGKTWMGLDNGFNRKRSVEDIGALLDWIATQPDLDPERVLLYGGSYGGYMVLASMIDYADRVAGGVDVVGISDFATFLTNTKGYRRDLRRVEYGDERDPKMAEFFKEISPLRNASKITKPLFVIQGLNDPRVPASEAEQIVEVVRAGGGEVWYLLAKDEGHGFRKQSNRAYMREAAALFISRVLGLDADAP